MTSWCLKRRHSRQRRPNKDYAARLRSGFLDDARKADGAAALTRTAPFS